MTAAQAVLNEAVHFISPIMLSTSLPFRHLIQQVEELWKADPCRLRSTNQRLAIRPQRRHAEGHRNAVVPSRIKRRSMQRLPTRDVNPILEFFHLGPHPAQ